MPDLVYRAYFIGSDGHFIGAKIIPCDDDDSAITAAQQLVNGEAVELWHGSRKIATFDGLPNNATGI